MLVIRPITLSAVALCASLLSTAAQAVPFTNFTTLHDFTFSPDGREPFGGVTAMGGVLYGTTNVGGTSDSGTIYRIDPVTGAEAVLYSFLGPFGGEQDGSLPEGELAAGTGVLYGTTSFGGEFNAGTVFRFDVVNGVETVLHSFGAGSDGATPAAGPILIGDKLFGTTSAGGDAGLGTVFSVDLATGDETVLYSFVGGADGSAPFAPVIFDAGLLYGTTFFGGPSNDGTVFKVDARTGNETVLHAFAGEAFSGNPAAGLRLRNGFLYGTTSHGGIPNCGGGCGTVFQVDAVTGAETDIYAFTSQTDGEDPEGGLVYRRGILFGTTLTGGRSGLGTVFAVDIETGQKTTLHDFEGRGAGINPDTLLSFGGALFGTTHGGGDAGQGTVFRLTR